MKYRALISILIFTVLIFSCNCNAEQKGLEVGQVIQSPDKQFIVKVTSDPSDDSVVGGITITSSSTGQVFQADTTAPLYSIKWTGDSKTVALIVYVAGGSEAEIYHLRNNKWVAYEPEPTIGDHFTVIRQAMGDHSVDLTYKVGEKNTGKFYIYTFVFDPETVARSNEKVKEIDLDKYRSLELGRD
jgi:hypothetical protein